ncbi:MAG: hypothetical protein J0H12_03600 [Candidatus Paracaedimonas acanthamoebae]|uniref:NTP pyrophosphohydrolase MazG-like domain-containing protein n=1 Tax=Candidatus Paracaedimonas acanthamoebae TaxID=244581 RepID=A0A8J7PXW4_9PROT|nr:hypothetical protein [Candidatus Paracaedimonas acanthamoebae]
MEVDWLTKAIFLNKISDEVGFAWEDVDQIFDKIHYEFLEVKEAFLQQEGQDRITEEIGDLMFSVISLACFLKIDPERAFTYGITKYEKRFDVVLKIFKEKEITLGNKFPLEFLLEVWKEAKARVDEYGAAGED